MNGDGKPSLWPRLGIVIPLAMSLLASVSLVRGGLGIYDEGLLLTIGRFSSWKTLPYRDLWTLYGPGTSIFGSIITALFGRTEQAFRGYQVLLALVMVSAVYELMRAYVDWRLAVVLASFVGLLVPVPFHYLLAFGFMFWGLVVIQKDLARRPALEVAAAAEPASGGRRLWVGFGLMGLSFLGRYEFSVVTIGLVLLLGWLLRGSVERRYWRRAVAAGLALPLLFLLWLVVFVPWATLYENFFHYPVKLYGNPECRGIPTNWQESFTALGSGFDGSFWTGHEIVLIAGNLLAPLVAVALLLCVIRFRRNRSTIAVLTAAALLVLLLFVEMRPRNGANPEPVVPLTLVAVAMLIFLIREKSAKVGLLATWSAGLLFLAVLVNFWPPQIWTIARDWPEYNSRELGFTLCTPADHWFCPATMDPVFEAVHSRVLEGKPIFVALTDNSGHFANAATLYWVLDRPPASRFIEFSPCLTDRDDIQSLIVADLKEVDVVVESNFYLKSPPFGKPATVLDEYLGREFEIALDSPLQFSQTGEAYRVLVRKSDL